MEKVAVAAGPLSDGQRLSFFSLLPNLCAFSLLQTGRVDVSAQVVTTQPEVITQYTKNVVITFHADWGNRGMVGLSSSAAVYAHTGVITDKSKSNQDWLYCTSNWNTPQAKFKMTYAGPNLWTLTIPDIREWYGVPEGETIEKLTFVFHAKARRQDPHGRRHLPHALP